MGIKKRSHQIEKPSIPTGRAEEALSSFLRSEIETAKQLLNFKSEIYRLPKTPRTMMLLNIIDWWFNQTDKPSFYSIREEDTVRTDEPNESSRSFVAEDGSFGTPFWKRRPSNPDGRPSPNRVFNP